MQSRTKQQIYTKTQRETRNDDDPSRGRSEFSYTVYKFLFRTVQEQFRNKYLKNGQTRDGKMNSKKFAAVFPGSFFAGSRSKINGRFFCGISTQRIRLLLHFLTASQELLPVKISLFACISSSLFPSLNFIFFYFLFFLVLWILFVRFFLRRFFAGIPSSKFISNALLNS